MTVYYSVGLLSPTFISWTIRNLLLGVETETENKTLKGLPEWNPLVHNYRCKSVSKEISLTLVFA